MTMYLYLQTLLSRIARKEQGQDLTEYALLIAVIALIVVFAALFFGNELSSWFANLGAAIPLT